MAGTTGLEPAASAVTGQRSNQLNYVPTRQINEMRNRQCLCGFASIAYDTPVAPGLPKEPDFWLNRRQIVASLCAFSDVPKKTARSTPSDPSCHLFGSHRQQTLSKSLAQKYPNSFSQNAKASPSISPCFAINAFLDDACNQRALIRNRLSNL